VRVSGNHWGLFILADQGNAYQVYYTSSGQGIVSEIKQIQPLISQITDQKTANNIQILTGAKQKDGYNCGVYLIFYIQELLETGKLELTKIYTSQEIQAFRQA